MSVIIIPMRTHRVTDITDQFKGLNDCIKHNKKPKIFEVIAGHRREVHYTAGCDSDECGKITTDKNEIANIWNKYNSTQ